MSKYKLKPLIAEALTFDELMEYGRTQTDNVYNNMPWSFEYLGYAVTHETDTCYIISCENDSVYFTPEKMIVLTGNEQICVLDLDQFNRLYELIEE